MKGKINRLKEIRIELDKITEDCFQDHYPSYISNGLSTACLLYTSPSPRDRQKSRMPSSA